MTTRPAADQDTWNGVALLLLALCLLLFAWESRCVHSQLDDSYISYRYAQNLADGHGLVFNAGERVEGFSNLLWTLLVAGGIALGGKAESIGHILGALSGAALLVGTCLYAALILPRDKQCLAGLAPALVLASNSFASWTASGLETSLFAALVTFALIAQATGRIGQATALCVLATLTRPDGVLIAAVVVGWDFLSRLRKDPDLLRDLRTWLPGLTYAGSILGLTCFRLVYYGEWVPNTFYAKVGGLPLSLGFWYVVSFLADGPGLLLLAVPFSFRGERKPWPGALFTLIVLIYLVYVGGDVFKNGRFLLPVLPFLVAASLRGTLAVWTRVRIAGAALALCVPAFVIWSLFVSIVIAGPDPHLALRIDNLPHSAKREDARRFNFLTDDQVKAQVHHIAALPTPVDLVAHTAIGRFGYYSGLPVLDLLGLVDPRVARSSERGSGAKLPGHQRSNVEYVFSRNPDLIVIPHPKARRDSFVLPAVAALWADPRLEERYRWDRKIKAYRRLMPDAE